MPFSGNGGLDAWRRGLYGYIGQLIVLFSFGTAVYGGMKWLAPKWLEMPSRIETMENKLATLPKIPFLEVQTAYAFPAVGSASDKKILDGFPPKIKSGDRVTLIYFGKLNKRCDQLQIMNRWWSYAEKTYAPELSTGPNQLTLTAGYSAQIIFMRIDTPNLTAGIWAYQPDITCITTEVIETLSVIPTMIEVIDWLPEETP